MPVKTMWHTAVKNHSFVNKTLRYRQHVRFSNDKRSERFNTPKKATYKEFYDLVVISYQVRTLTLKTNLHRSDDKENLIRQGWREGVGGGGIWKIVLTSGKILATPLLPLPCFMRLLRRLET